MIYHLISSPRNVSTALMYAFHHRGDMQVFDEPYYGYYLSETGVDHPGKEEIIDAMDLDVTKINTDIKAACCSSHGFVKNMAHHFLAFDLPEDDAHFFIFLIRDPKLTIHSFAKVIDNPTLSDIGLKRMHELYEFAVAGHLQHVVVDSSDLLLDPEKNMATLCEHLGLVFKPGMVSWQPGAIDADGVWAKYWYANVHQRSGLQKLMPEEVTLADTYMPLYEEALPYFNTLSKNKIVF